jgi:hypothetical protein
MEFEAKKVTVAPPTAVFCATCKRRIALMPQQKKAYSDPRKLYFCDATCRDNYRPRKHK